MDSCAVDARILCHIGGANGVDDLRRAGAYALVGARYLRLEGRQRRIASQGKSPCDAGAVPDRYLARYL